MMRGSGHFYASADDVRASTDEHARRVYEVYDVDGQTMGYVVASSQANAERIAARRPRVGGVTYTEV